MDCEFRPSLKELTVTPIIENPKGELQESLQAVSPEAPHYEVVSSTGPDHDRVFECTVHHGGKELARGTGKSKKAAESEAALAALAISLNFQIPTRRHCESEQIISSSELGQIGRSRAIKCSASMLGIVERFFV